MRVALVTPGHLPVPATLGGAVETLAESLVIENEGFGLIDLRVYSVDDPDAARRATTYERTRFIFVRAPHMVKILNDWVYRLARIVLHRRNTMSFRHLIQRLHYLRAVARHLKNEDYDIVVLENHPSLFWTLKLHGNRKRYSGRYYFHMHNEVKAGFGCMQVLLGSKRVLGVSQFVNKSLQERCGDHDLDKYRVLRNRVDATWFRASDDEAVRELRSRYGMPQDAMVVLFSGRLCPEKGVLELLRAFTEVVHDFNVVLVIAGAHFFGSGATSEYEEHLSRLADALGERVIMTGFVPYSMMPTLYAMADVVVAPSLWEDPAPLSVIEPLTCGKALITSRSGGIPEYAGEANSILIDRSAGLTERIAESLRELLGDQRRRHAMEDAARVLTADWTSAQYYLDFCRLIGVADIGEKDQFCDA